ncbi:rab-GTPase-TBC domain-containing protein [Lactifluus volemus]|nr:rab-GTPase-TBC domain-containing protein [Lactifluus volemus]
MDNDDQVIVQERVGKLPPESTSFYVDDAFSDSEDVEPHYELELATIRADLARAVTFSQEEEVPRSSEDPLHIDIVIPDTLTPSLEGNQLYAKFDSVSLSPVEGPSKLSHEDDHDDLQNQPEITDDASDQDHTGHDSGSETQQREVYYDESHSVDTNPDSPPPSSLPSEPPPDSPTSGEDPETHAEQSHRQKASSSPSLQLPPIASPSAVSSPPRPESSHQIHKITRSTGPSTFEKVLNKTRPSFLPPKSKDEDQKHMADWQKMMKRSRAAEEKRRKAQQERRLARELQVEQSLHIWEKEILPDWKIVHRNPGMRKLWWAGIPTKLRATMWERAVGNALALSKDTYRICLARAKRALAAGTFPTTSLGLIEQDVQNTLPSLHIFHPDSGPMYEELKDMLYAWVVSRSDEGLGYVQGTARIAAMILINMSAGPGFIVMKNLLERHCMRSFYGGLSTKDDVGFSSAFADVEAYYRIFDTLLADGMPKIYFNFKQHQIFPSAYLQDWIMPLFLDHLPFDACARLWDVILLEGDAFLYRASLAILAVLEARLFFPDRQELLELLRGENKAALEVARRDGRALNGGKYEIYGLDEEALWDRIEFMNDWWKESTWTRLLQRELPDI